MSLRLSSKGFYVDLMGAFDRMAFFRLLHYVSLFLRNTKTPLEFAIRLIAVVVIVTVVGVWGCSYNRSKGTNAAAYGHLNLVNSAGLSPTRWTRLQ